MDILREADQYLEHQRNRERELVRLEAEGKKMLVDIQARRAQLELLDGVQVFLQTLSEATRDEITSGLQEIVTRCLQSVFGPHLHFEIEVETKRNNTGIEFYVRNESGEHSVRLKPEESMGGGVIDTISIGLRFGLLKILTPQPEGPIFLDEPAKMVSADRVDSVANLLKELTDLFDKQVLVVTHHSSITDIVDRANYVHNEDGRSILS